MYLLDTKIVSLLDPRRHAHTPHLIDWLVQNGASLFLSVMTVAEIEAGVLKLRRELKEKRANEVANLLRDILVDFSDRVLPVNIEIALHIARLSELTHRQPVPLPDLIIAATAHRHGLIVLTNNMREFERLGVAAINPVKDLPAE